jgi:hypothetical protein
MYRPRSLYLSVHTAPVAVPDRPEGQFSFPDTLSPAKQSSSTPDLCAKASPGDSTPPISSPSTAAKRLAAAGRRNSFLYETDGDTALPSSSLSSHMEETFVTPFAQILATMHKVRQSFIHLMNLPEDTHRHFHHKPLTPNPLSRKPPLTPFDRKLSLDTIRQVGMYKYLTKHFCATTFLTNVIGQSEKVMLGCFLHMHKHYWSCRKI